MASVTVEMPSSPADSKASSSSAVVTPDLKAGLVKSDSIISEQVVRKIVDILLRSLHFTLSEYLT
jgi:hypothetical protein